jgi:hypothetical protein
MDTHTNCHDELIISKSDATQVDTRGLLRSDDVDPSALSRMDLHAIGGYLPCVQVGFKLDSTHWWDFRSPTSMVMGQMASKIGPFLLVRSSLWSIKY